MRRTTRRCRERISTFPRWVGRGLNIVAQFREAVGRHSAPGRQHVTSSVVLNSSLITLGQIREFCRRERRPSQRSYQVNQLSTPKWNWERLAEKNLYAVMHYLGCNVYLGILYGRILRCCTIVVGPRFSTFRRSFRGNSAGFVRLFSGVTAVEINPNSSLANM
jgi:hypothetical protein